MANYNRNWDARPWDDDRYDRYRGDHYDRDDDMRHRQRNENYGRRELEGLDYDQKKNWARNSGYDRGQRNEDRYLSDNDNSYNRGVYGNSTGAGRGTDSYLAGQGRRGNEYGPGYSNRHGYPGSDYGDFSNRRHEDRDWWDRTKDEVASWFGDEDAARRRNMDEVRGRHRGRGPKGYTRSDDRIREDINDRLMDDSHVDATEIDVRVENGDVILSGYVGSRFEKRHAEDIADLVSGVKNVENRLRVDTYQDRNYRNEVRSGDAGRRADTTDSNFGATGALPVGAFDNSKPDE